MKRHTLGAVFCALTLSLAGCGTPSPSLPDDPCPTPQTPIFSVEKIPSLKSNLIFGIDTSSLISLEQSGVTFYDFDGNQADALQTLAQAGVNCIRLRVWNDPFDENGNGYGGGNCTIDTAIALGKRATAYGMTTMINFHYSDFWADPGKQTAPIFTAIPFRTAVLSPRNIPFPFKDKPTAYATSSQRSTPFRIVSAYVTGRALGSPSVARAMKKIFRFGNATAVVGLTPAPQRTKQTAPCITAVAPWTIRLCLTPRATPWTA